MEVMDKTAVITGGIGGIGFMTTQHLLRNEAKYVGILDIAEESDERVQTCLNKLGEEFGKDRFGYYKCDVTNYDEFKDCYKKVYESQKYVDILINNAGILADKDVDKNIDINVKAVIKGTLLAIEYMDVNNGGHGGCVVNIASTAGLQNYYISPVYNASKHAVVSFVRSMKANCEKIGVRVVCICPGFTNTNLFQSWEDTLLPFVSNEKIPEILEKHPLQKPENVAAAVVDIISRGAAGDVWLTTDDKPPKGISEINEAQELTYDLCDCADD